MNSIMISLLKEVIDIPIIHSLKIVY